MQCPFLNDKKTLLHELPQSHCIGFVTREAW